MYAIRVRVTDGDGGVDAAAAGIDDVSIDDSFASLRPRENNGEAEKEVDDLPAQVPFTAGNPLVEHITGIVHLYRRVPTREEAEEAGRAGGGGGQVPSSSSSAPAAAAGASSSSTSSTAAATPLASLASLNEEDESDQLCILALPGDLAVADLCAFLGPHLARVRSVRLVRRAAAVAAAAAVPPAEPSVSAAAPAPSAVVAKEAAAAAEEEDKETGKAGEAEAEEEEPERGEGEEKGEGTAPPLPPPPPPPLPLPPMPRLALLRLDSPRAAAEARRDLDAKPFSSLDPEVLCRIVPVRHVEVDESSRGERGEEREGTATATTSTSKKATLATLPPPPNRPPPPGTTELPPCPVCLERLDDHVSGVVTTVCNHVFHADCLQRWAGASCPVCRYAGGGPSSSSSSSSAAFLGALSNLPGASAAAIAANAAAAPSSSSQSRCSTCSATHDLWICLICGHVSCLSFGGLDFFLHFFALTHKKNSKKNLQ